ncbi:hypothetical protein C463_03949 [Halorubrum californiense DSM 19288]|uniref:Archaeal Type IV pilin N-terminal domain-containing protein n=1 Tax=Halorubrum californiense DSM 19288 TaxID=1227465 RepID=M0EFP1_9EURY|nr:hypothetical protein C463_03949 [Halorubrum californiense DSM 19288]
MGVILLLAVFVVSASAIGIAYVGGVDSDADEVVISADLSANGTDLRVDHLRGDALPNEALAVVVRANGNATRYPFAPPLGEFAPGDSRAFPDALAANESNEVALYHEPSGEQIALATLTPEPEPVTETGSIEGTVVGPGAASMRVASGASFGVRQVATPLVGATVAVDGAGRVAEATTGSRGAYRIDGLEPAEYEVSAAASGLALSATTVDVDPDETATTTVEVLDAAIDAVAYVDRDGDGDPDEQYTPVELAFLGSVDGHLVVYDDVEVTAAADRVTIRDGVTIRADGVSLESGGNLRVGGDLNARGATVTTAARDWIFASAGDIGLTVGGTADLREGRFDATGVGLSGGRDGRITVTAGSGVLTDGASFDPDLA